MSRKFAPETLKVVREIERIFYDGREVAFTYVGHGRNGEAWGIDFPTNWTMGKQPTKAEEEFGDKLQRYFEKHWNRLGIDYGIWWDWMKECKGCAWFRYGPYADAYTRSHPAASTNWWTVHHFDHWHLSLIPGFVYHPPG